MNTREVLARMRRRQQLSAQRGDQRHRALDHELDEMKEVRATLVAGFDARITQIETNTGRIGELERQITALADKVAAHQADAKQHTGKS